MFRENDFDVALRPHRPYGLLGTIRDGGPRIITGLTATSITATSIIFWSLQTHVKYACHDKTFVATKMIFVTAPAKGTGRPPTNRLSRENYVCRDKHVFVATKMILVAAPTNDTERPPRLSHSS